MFRKFKKEREGDALPPVGKGGSYARHSRGWADLLQHLKSDENLRVLDFGAVAALLVLSQKVLKPLAIRPLVLLGQSSLQVFCVHLLFCFAGLTLMGNASMLNGWRQFALLSVTFTAMLITAKIFAKAEAKNERQAKTDVSSEPDEGTNWRVPSGPAARETAG